MISIFLHKVQGSESDKQRRKQYLNLRLLLCRVQEVRHLSGEGNKEMCQRSEMLLVWVYFMGFVVRLNCKNRRRRLSRRDQFTEEFREQEDSEGTQVGKLLMEVKEQFYFPVAQNLAQP